MAARENDRRLCVAEHVGQQSFGQGGVEEHHRAARLEDAEVSGDDLPVVLRHSHGHHLIGARKEGRKCRGHALRLRVEFGVGQKLPSVRNVQRRMLRKSLDGPAKDFRQPADPPLMGDVDDIAVEDISETVGAGVSETVRL